MENNTEIPFEEQNDLEELTDSDKQELQEFKGEILDGLSDGISFKNSGWKMAVQDLYSLEGDEISALGRQRKRILERYMPKEILENIKQS